MRKGGARTSFLRLVSESILQEPLAKPKGYHNLALLEKVKSPEERPWLATDRDFRAEPEVSREARRGRKEDLGRDCSE